VRTAELALDNGVVGASADAHEVAATIATNE
jgi:hypothetical protein